MSNYENNTYRTVSGFVYAGPYDRSAGSKKVRDVYVSVPSPLVNEKGEVTSQQDTKVRVTIWDSHDAVEVVEGDYIVANGKFEIYDGQNQQGDNVRSYSLSANRLRNFGSGLGEFKDRGVENAPKTSGRPARNNTDIPGL